jgi:hypothetical protein
MTIAFVLSGGGSLGAVRVGMLPAHAERDVHPDLLIGTSAGAINNAYVAGHGTSRPGAPGSERDLAGPTPSGHLPLDPLRHLLALVGHRAALCSDGNLRRLIETHRPYRKLENAAIPLHLAVASTDFSHADELIERAQTATGDWLRFRRTVAAGTRTIPVLHHKGTASKQETSTPATTAPRNPQLRASDTTRNLNDTPTSSPAF